MAGHLPFPCPFDIIIYATGFDAIIGAFDRIDIGGVDGSTRPGFQ
jgi:hypothetical protein